MERPAAWILKLSVLFIVLIVYGQSSAHAQSFYAYDSAVVAKIDLSSQRMTVYVDGKKKYFWRVSTGKKGWRTPTGYYQPYDRHRKYYEKRWRMSLPYLVSISYSGIAIHGTTLVSRLGRPASHGCIRLSIPNAKRFYDLVGKRGLNNTQVVVVQ